MKRIVCSIAAAVVILSLLPVSGWAAELLIPVGEIIGLQLQDNTVTVAAFEESADNPARDAGVMIGDEIVSIDGHAIHCAQDIRKALESGKAKVSMTVRRGSKSHTLSICPEATADGPRLGIYLRQGIAGIGTVTWYDPDTGRFGTLGHGVSNAKGKLLDMTEGQAFEAEVISVKKGKCGEPGQLRGSAEAEDVCGKLLRNTAQGVFGTTRTGWQGEPMPVADYAEICVGPASIRSTIQGDTPREYSVEILKIYPEDRHDGRNFLLKVTDPALLEVTGGIVQGMGVIDNMDNTKKPVNAGFSAVTLNNEPNIGV